MTNFTTITELEILRLASFELLAMASKEADRLRANPESQIAQHRHNKFYKQYDEIKKRIITLENAI
ncbi:hypothetical protein [Desulfosporosinus youngiae]|uniref:Uncharacterized protein n=1 Tax=Desulfosporosinus youngiae DSM 17734 TaxID=768710 RepID=H5XZR6_9FIRM|nr:hypothetical protein [Desulfosporosinus youngiae]EHQ92112.1 hypothetical protein DesyoDRAFT_5181 [Desulfosporosinus youngiae DSM 17734]